MTILKSMKEDSIVLDRKLSRMDRSEILEALRIVLRELSDSYMVDPSEFQGKEYIWITKGEYERMIIARLNGMIK